MRARRPDARPYLLWADLEGEPAPKATRRRARPHKADEATRRLRALRRWLELEVEAAHGRVWREALSEVSGLVGEALVVAERGRQSVERESGAVAGRSRSAERGSS